MQALSKLHYLLLGNIGPELDRVSYLPRKSGVFFSDGHYISEIGIFPLVSNSLAASSLARYL